jgi:hypothetical protein
MGLYDLSYTKKINTKVFGSSSIYTGAKIKKVKKISSTNRLVICYNEETEKLRNQTKLDINKRHINNIEYKPKLEKYNKF